MCEVRGWFLLECKHFIIRLVFSVMARTWRLGKVAVQGFFHLPAHSSLVNKVGGRLSPRRLGIWSVVLNFSVSVRALACFVMPLQQGARVCWHPGVCEAFPYTVDRGPSTCASACTAKPR